MEREVEHRPAAEERHRPTAVEKWPPFRGDYVIDDLKSRVAVVTLAAHIEVRGAAIYGPCKTENLGVEKVVANVISNPNIRFLLICGRESKGHLPGDAISAIHRNGIDQNGKILGARGAIPFIQNISTEAISRFQSQVTIIERIGLEDSGEINRIVEEHRFESGPYPDGPFLVVKQRTLSKVEKPGEGDVILGPKTALDTSSWLVVEQNQKVEESGTS